MLLKEVLESPSPRFVFERARYHREVRSLLQEWRATAMVSLLASFARFSSTMEDSSRFDPSSWSWETC